MELFDVPARAIATFEQIHHLRVTVHDFTGMLWPFLPPEKFRHHDPRCEAMKNSPRGEACWAFDVYDLREQIPAEPAGRVQCCHAGYVEWVVPILDQRSLQMVLFAGLRTMGKDLQANPRPRSLPVLGSTAPPPVDDATAQLILEHLRQLATRLKQWTIDVQPLLGKPDHSPITAAERQTAIRGFIVHRHAQPVRLADLAARLRLTESRTSHVVRELFGQTFPQLLAEARIRTAMGLLRHSSMPVMEVAARSGFEDLRHFHRQFKKHTGQTPHRYRRQKE